VESLSRAPMGDVPTPASCCESAETCGRAQCASSGARQSTHACHATCHASHASHANEGHAEDRTERCATLVPSSRPSEAPKTVRRIVGQVIPEDIRNNEALQRAVAILPANYNFEIEKTIWRLRQAKVRKVALQFPEGLLMYSCVIADILESFAGIECAMIMGDVTFGACCVDDYSAKALDAEFLVHYGHSCLVPVGETSIPCMYVFVDIKMDVDHFVETVKLNFDLDTRIILAGTIQFASSLHAAKGVLEESGFERITVPQSRPLSRGETLGCTAPVVEGEHDAIVFLADGRFHLEALMIANPTVTAYRYDPYGRTMTEETYDQAGMRAQRRAAIEKARGAKHWGLILGTLGRQGNPKILDKIKELMRARGASYTLVLLSEVSPQKIAMLSQDIDVFVQIACPRLSIDWGDEFSRPTLNPYEAFVALGEVRGFYEEGGEDYPMDFYSKEGGAWNSSWHKIKPTPRPRAAECSR
jgi:2-(3-amino-3-carboxypropyl)histidine synthase